MLENHIDVYDCTADDNDIIQEEKERIQVKHLDNTFSTFHVYFYINHLYT